MLESSVARVDKTHSYFVAISCVTLMTRYQMAMLTTQVLIMNYKGNWVLPHCRTNSAKVFVLLRYIYFTNFNNVRLSGQ